MNGEMKLNKAGKMIQATWRELENRFHDMESDEFVVMPNHFHGIAWIVETQDCFYGNVPPGVGADLRVRPNLGQENTVHGPTHRSAPTLGRRIQWFKTLTTNYYIQGVRNHHWPPFPGTLWQRGYYEHVIRNENELFQIRRYIQENPVKWDLDPENPNHTDKLDGVK